jgi:NitT/TauT family transport system ATP-binding protein
MSASGYYEYGDTLLKADGVNLNLGGRQILRDVNLEIKDLKRPGLKQGQVVGLLGPSGMGKTQLFRILSGLNIPDTGRVTLHGGKAVTPGTVGVVAQNYPMFNHRTIASNMAVACRQGAKHGQEGLKATSSLMEKFGIADHMDKYPAQLSGGQRQRAAIAQQLLCSDNILLMDEPFSGLDPNALNSVCDFISEAAAMDDLITFVVVTHDIQSAIRICDTLWLLGRERDANGQPIPGANIRHTIDLVEQGVAWRKGVEDTPEFFEQVKSVKALFAGL